MTTMMDEVLVFLRARLDEDEEAARDALRVMSPGGLYVASFCLHLPPEVQQHNDRHDPARVLREVDAKRRVLDAYVEVAEMDTPDPEPEFAYGRAVGLGEVIRLLALPYNDHPDYRQEWAP